MRGTYYDPHGLIEGRSEISTYMGEFQRSLPRGIFKIRNVILHHDRTLANWALHGPSGDVLQTGASFGLLSKDGRLQNITGFFQQATDQN